LTPTQQQGAFAPQAGTLSTGEQIFPTVTTPGVGGMLPRIQMGAQPLADVGLPPTTQVVSPTGETRLLGPASQRGNVPLTTGLGPAQTSLLGAGATTMATDLSATIKDAAEAPSRVAIFQNIKKFAPDSFTGVGGQRKELAAGILNAIGIPAYEAEKVSTEELAKNSALLALAGGNTDAARALAEVATPNKKLNEKAILAIADQMIGIENMKVAKANYLTPVQNDSTQYGQRKLQFDQIADPRIFQEMTAQDVAKLKTSMSAAEQAELTRKIRLARQMGIIR
jgi:ribosomal protein S18